MPRTPAPGTRERILRAAGQLFYEHGVQAVGMSRVIAEAGTGKSLLYQHFATKDDLVAAYLDEVRAVRESSSRRARERAGTGPGDQLRAVLTEIADAVRAPGFRGCAFRNYLVEFPCADPRDDSRPAGGAGAKVAVYYLTTTRREIAELVDGLGVLDPGQLTEQLWLLVDGMYAAAAYRPRLDGDTGSGPAAALRLAEHLVQTWPRSESG